MRPHTPQRKRQHQAFLDAYQNQKEQLNSTIEWFETLPLWLDLGDIRVIHACWDTGAMNRIKELLTDNNCLTGDFLNQATAYGSQSFKDVETLLKGKEVVLPEGHSFTDKDGHEWPNIRIRWWDQMAKTYQSAFFGRPADIAHIPDAEINGDYCIDYSHDEPPVFLGHYWMDGKPTALADNIVCVDYSVAKQGGKLVAYRWSGEEVLLAENFVYIDRQEK